MGTYLYLFNLLLLSLFAGGSCSGEDSLRSELDQLKAEIATLKSQSAIYRDQLAQFQTEVGNELIALKSEGTSFQRVGTSSTLQNVTDPGSVSFTAIVTRTDTYSGNDPIRFQRIVHNEGGAYNNATGLFTCPVGGVYLFSASLYIGTGACVTIKKEGVVYTALYTGLDIGHASTTAVIRCEAGERVWASNIGNTNGYIYGENFDPNYPTSSMTGILLA